MLEPPSLADHTILAALRAHYGIAGAVLTFPPIGNDSASFVYRVDAANGATYFLKARSGAGFSALSLTVPFFLHSQGIPHVKAPLPTTGQALPLSTRALVYYRFALVVQDMAAYAEQVFFAPDAGEPTGRAAMQGFAVMFKPGNIVDITLAGVDSVRGV